MRSLRAIAGLLAVALVISACSEGATAVPDTTATPVPTLSPMPTAAPVSTPTTAPTVDTRATPFPTVATAVPTVVPTAAPPEPTAPALADKQEFRANLGGEPTSLDPQRAGSALDFSTIRQAFRGLLGFSPDLGLEAVSAAEVPTVENGGITEDGLTYTFRLRDDVTWSDGEPVTAGDFEYSIKRLLNPEVAAPFTALYLAIGGALEYNSAGDQDAAARQALRDLVRVEATGGLTLRVTLERPSPTFLQKMALVPVYPVRRDVVEEFGDSWTEAETYVGNGPYVMTEWVHQDHITFEINPEYWGPTPTLTKITYRMITDVNAEQAAYRNDELDLASVPPGTERAVLDDPSLGQEVVRSPELFSLGIFLNLNEPPFDNLKVRQAFATAIDRAAWIDSVKNGVGQPATSWLPPGLPGYDRRLGGEYTFDPQRAGQLLAEAGFPDGDGLPSISLTHVTAGDQPVMAQFIQAQLKENLGVDVGLDPIDPAIYGQRVVGARQFQMTPFGWIADYPDPENFFVLLFVSGAPINVSSYSSSEFDRLAGLAATELDQGRRVELWKQAHEILVQDVPVVFFFYGERLFLKKPRVDGLAVTSVDGVIPGDTRLTEVFLTP